MDGMYPRSSGPEAWHVRVREVLEAGRRAVASYRAAEPRVTDHRVQAALQQLRKGHERHVAELASILEESGGDGMVGGAGGSADGVSADGGARAVVAHDGGDLLDPLSTLMARGVVEGREVLEAVRRMELDIRDRYAECVDSLHVEPIRAVLSRHRREEEAHVAWLYESPLWRGAYDEDGLASG